MSRSRLRVWLGCAMCAGVLLAAASPARCAAPWGEPSEAEKKIEEALGDPVQLEFIECPLQDVVHYMKDLHDIEIQIDKRALEEIGIGADTPITRNLKGIALRSALNLILRELDLTYLVTDEVLLITTLEEAAGRAYTKIYPVADLIGGDAREQAGARDCAALVDILGQLLRCMDEPVAEGRPGAGRLPGAAPAEGFSEGGEFPGAPGAGFEGPRGARRGWMEGGVGAPRRGVRGQGDLLPIPPERPKALVVKQDRAGHERVAELLGMLRLAASSGRETAPTPIRRVPAAEKKIAEALNSPTQIEFIETPLADVVDFLRSKHEIEIQIDGRALEDVGIGTDTPITRNLKGITLRSALRLTLRDEDLTWVVRDEVLLITTLEEAKKWSLVKVYPLAGLIPADLKDPERRQAYAESLADTVRQLILPTTWDERGGVGSVMALSTGKLDVLVVLQRENVHAEIAGLLSRPEFRQE